MISKSIYKFCSENISQIENFLEAINDRFEVWDCHHRLEIQGEKVYSAKELEDLNLYWNRPASELIFLKKNEHSALHSSNCGWNGKNANKTARGFCKPGANFGFTKKSKWHTPSGEIKEMNKGIVKRYHKDWVEIK